MRVLLALMPVAIVLGFLALFVSQVQAAVLR